MSDGGNESCPLLAAGARKSFESMWRAGLGERPGHDCGAYDRRPLREPKPEEPTEPLF